MTPGRQNRLGGTLSPLGEVWGIVVAAGAGRRFGKAKQFEALSGQRVLDWSIAAARSVCDQVVIVLPPDQMEPGAQPGGDTRSASVRAGLAAVPDSAEIVIVHDAARPLAGPEVFARVLAAVRAGADAAVPVVPVADTIKRVQGNRVAATLDRQTLVAVQTPQAFRADALRRAHASQPEASDDAALVEAGGGMVVTVAGDRRNFKLTDPDDLLVAGLFLARP
jgi:2-C-methyl-D-erythritol 4-phosphate cytidylyltransferase